MTGASLFLPEVFAYFEWAKEHPDYWNHPLTQGRGRYQMSAPQEKASFSFFLIKKMRGCKTLCFSAHFLDIENLQD
ncbi:hypothetical protein J4211_03845 [Candidatus Woesearchaeota archaeon]|nr:hypothetical protein [Candidatus Woesearchaeota archaeon]